MIYFLDANVFIQAEVGYYSFETVPGFWDWMTSECDNGSLKSLTLVRTELVHPEHLKDWADDRAADGFFIEPSDDAIQRQFQEVAEWVRSHPVYAEAHVASFLAGADPWLIATAATLDATVVTQEVLAPDNSTKVKIPNVAGAFGVRTINTFELMGELGARLHHL